MSVLEEELIIFSTTFTFSIALQLILGDGLFYKMGNK